MAGAIIANEIELSHDLVEFVRLTEMPERGFGYRVSSPWLCVHDNLPKLEKEMEPFFNEWTKIFDEFVTACVRNEWLTNRHPVAIPERAAWSLSSPDHPIRARSTVFVNDPVPLRFELTCLPPVAPYEPRIDNERERWYITDNWTRAPLELAFWSDHVPQKTSVRVFLADRLVPNDGAAYGDRFQLEAFLFVPRGLSETMNHSTYWRHV